ncbi:NRDE family protein [Thermocatellispora tengchongensis]|uniref:NRDE family protein n=1 Tax=Thermocatellispora tengchongensis TaxID=1073253 RepID=UPI0036326658
MARALCTVIVSLEPGAPVPVLLAGVRDEFAERPWEGPGEHWPRSHPGVLGGRDLQAGGTWLAVHPAARRVAALLNGRGVLAAQERRRSRGDLPLRAVELGEPPDEDLTRYDPFHLVVADAGGVRLWHWDGVRLTDDKPAPGTHVIVNSGWEQGGENARAAYFRDRFAAAPRPGPIGGGEDPPAYWGSGPCWPPATGSPRATRGR